MINVGAVRPAGTFSAKEFFKRHPPSDAGVAEGRKRWAARLDGTVSPVKQLRMAAGLSQEQLATRIGTNQAYISRLESRSHLPTVERMEELATVLGVSFDEVRKAFNV